MLKYKILNTSGDTNGIIPLSLNFNTKLDIDDNDNIDNIIQTFINPIDNNEQEAYSPLSAYTINFYFYNSSVTPIYNNSWLNAGFNLPTDLTKNIFQKSLFLLEFYADNQGGSNNMLFSTTLSIYPNPSTSKGSNTINNGGTVTYDSSFTIDNPKNEIYNFFFNRDFSDLTNIQQDSNGNYVSLYVKSIFLNASTGIPQYFTNIQTVSSFNQTLYFYEVRFYDNYTYAFFNNGNLINNINLYELVLN